jgi:hypothetical protein
MGIITIKTIASVLPSYIILTTMCVFFNLFSALSSSSGKLFLFRSHNNTSYNALSQVLVRAGELLCCGRTAATAEARTTPSVDAKAVKPTACNKVTLAGVFIGYVDGLALCGH